MPRCSATTLYSGLRCRLRCGHANRLHWKRRNVSIAQECDFLLYDFLFDDFDSERVFQGILIESFSSTTSPDKSRQSNGFHSEHSVQASTWNALDTGRSRHLLNPPLLIAHKLALKARVTLSDAACSQTCCFQSIAPFSSKVSLDPFEWFEQLFLNASLLLLPGVGPYYGKRLAKGGLPKVTEKPTPDANKCQQMPASVW